jgi:hypothetical protein
MRRKIPIFLAGGEVVVAIIALRIAFWMARGWRDWRAVAGGGDEPIGPGGGLRVIPGGRTHRVERRREGLRLAA